MNQSHKTAKTRKTVSAPMKYLHKHDRFSGRMLDYGCGKGFDADLFGMDKFDPHFTGGEIIGQYKKDYDTITCNYVLNVIESDCDRNDVLAHIKSLLRPGGIAYITVRRDIVKEGVTKSGTYQTNVVLDLPVLVEVTKKYCIYVLHNDK